MIIEDELFQKTKVDFTKLKKYGFVKKENYYEYQKNFFDNNFKAIITIDKSGHVKSKIIDLIAEEEYLNIHVVMSGQYVNKVKDEYKNLLLDIRNHCFHINYFSSNQANRITSYIKEKYGDLPEFLWDNNPLYGVFRNKINHKWYGIIMNIDYSKLDKKTGQIDIINVKLERDRIIELLKRKNYYPAYHMNKKDWISIVLNDSLDDLEIISLIDISYDLVKNV